MPCCDTSACIAYASLCADAHSNRAARTLWKIDQPKPAVQPLGADVAAADSTILIEARRDGDRVILGVTDHGCGIPEGDRKHAVERFVRLEASRTLPGSGLGLSLASAVATLHGGDLTLDDAHPGLRAALSIPARSGEGLAAPAPDVQQIGA